jgi:hypothetical protein
MNQVVVDNNLIISKHNEISESFLNELKDNKIDILDASEFIRIEHPHCAFFKSDYQAEDMTLKRTTLYTPERRLHSDYKQNDNGELERLNFFVKKETHLDTLLIYLRDIEIIPLNITLDKEYNAISMFHTPLHELLTLMDEDTLKKCFKKNEEVTIKALTQLGKIFEAKLHIIKNNLDIEDSYIVFPQVNKLKLDYSIVERWHLKYLNKL